MHRLIRMFLTSLFLCLSLAIQAEEATQSGMDNQRLDELIHRIDKSAQGKPGYWVFVVEGREVSVITDARADRMRIIIPITPTKDIDRDLLYRLMQANFDSALDARYSIANDILWAAFIHPLSALGDKEFLSGLGQTVNLALSYGDSYSSGALVFGGGDSQALRRRELIDKLLRDGLTI
ncbi:type III secretion system chaperone [Sulfuriflexus mobilis]|uniref:type III secretion system chaperone n=1 Tax=Sulfuriflexus mobilis TaxID=1811807 RepID=UPI000F835FD7|nr:type III secretion system chaperone [Sulfuriflexus mobilis]